MAPQIMTPAPAARLLRVRQITELYGITERTVRRWIAQDRLDVRRIGRSVFVTVDSVERLFSKQDR